MRVGVSMFLEFPAAWNKRRSPAYEFITLGINPADKNA